jgi:hypothetical protein
VNDCWFLLIHRSPCRFGHLHALGF